MHPDQSFHDTYRSNDGGRSVQYRFPGRPMVKNLLRGSEGLNMGPFATARITNERPVERR